MTLGTSLASVPSGGAQPPLGLLDRWPVWLAMGFVTILPLLLVDFPPLVDLYGHLGRYAVQTELDTRPALQPFYTYEWRLIGNLGADILIEVLHPLLGLEPSVRVVVILTQLLGAAGLLAISREVHGRVSPFAVMAIPLLYGYPFNYGFLNYALSMALAMLAFALWLRLHREGRGFAARVWLGVAGAAIWVAHTYGWAFLGLLTGSAMLAEVAPTLLKRPVAAVGRIVGMCWPLLLPIIPMVIWRADATGMAASEWSLDFKWLWVVSTLRTQTWALDVGALAIIAGTVLLALLCWRAFRFDPRIAIAALLCCAVFIALPFRVFGSAFADMRLVPYALALALVTIAPARARPVMLRVVTALALAFFAGRMAITGAAYVEQGRKVDDALAALGPVPDGARIAFFVVKSCGARWPMPVLDHAAGAAIARRNAFVNDQWQQPGVNPMTVHYPAAEPFVRDPSHLVQPEACPMIGRPKLSETLARLPLDAFTHVWIVGEYTEPVAVPQRLTQVPFDGSGLLYTVAPR